MQMIPVSSSAISAIGYDPNTRRMKIRFAQGDTYDFCGVPVAVYEGYCMPGRRGHTTATTSGIDTSAGRRGGELDHPPPFIRDQVFVDL